MLYLDTWVWLEYVIGGGADDAVTTVVNETHDRGGVTSTITLLELDSVVRRELDRETAEALVRGRDPHRDRTPHRL